MENKPAFVNDVIEALVRHGDGRYDWAEGICCESLPSGRDIIFDHNGRGVYDVTCDSLTSILKCIAELVG